MRWVTPSPDNVASRMVLARMAACFPPCPLMLYARLVSRRIGCEATAAVDCDRARAASPPDRAGAADLDLDLALPEDSLEAVRMKNKNLRARLQEMPWPRLTSFLANGQLYPVPWSPDPAFQTPFMERCHLQYLAGFFDGDGCVRVSHGRSRLEVGQSFDGADVLMLYYAAFGGGIYNQRHGVGLHRPVLRWALHRKKLALEAASLLAQHSITKRKQLHIAANWPETRSCRRIAADELKVLKQFDSSMATRDSCTWHYVAGLFDAEGSISQHGKSSLRLGLAQKHSSVLECVRTFLACELGVEVYISRSPGGNQLQVGTISTCQRIVEKLLGAGLIRKKRQAELALNFKPENAEHTRAALSSLNGNQRLRTRLDEAGLDRAYDIQKTQKQADYAQKHGRHAQAANLLKEVEAMRFNHNTRNAERENWRLHDYICKIDGLQREKSCRGIGTFRQDLFCDIYREEWQNSGRGLNSYEAPCHD